MASGVANHTNTMDIRNVATRDHHVGDGILPVIVTDAKRVSLTSTQIVDKSQKTYNIITPNPDVIEEIQKMTTNINPNNVKEELKTLQRKLKDQLQFYALPKVAWLDEKIFPQVECIEYFVKLQLNGSDDPIEMDEIFDPINSKIPLRILIEGEPGFGKTALAIKLANDWVGNEEYISRCFDIVFFIRAQTLQQKGIEEAIKKGIENYCPNTLNLVRRHEEKTLIILDGLHEVSAGNRSEVIKLLYKQVLSDVTVVVFCRTGSFALTRKECEDLFGHTDITNTFYDKQIRMVGIKGFENKRQFLYKFCPGHVNDIFKRFSPQLELFDSPLFLLTVIIAKDDKNTEEMSSKTQFYKMLFNCLVKHSYKKRQKDIDTDFDLFRFCSPLTEIQTLIRDFGKLSSRKIVCGDLTFNSVSDPIATTIYELGFLIYTEESENCYKILHLSIMEFAAAYSFWLDFKLNQLKFEELKPIINHFVSTNGSSQLMPFLIGLINEDLDHLLSKIDPFNGWFSLNFELTEKLLSECLLNNISNSQFLTNFIPSQINLCRDYSLIITDFLQKRIALLTYGIKRDKIKRLKINDVTPSKLFTNGNNTCLEVDLDIFKVFSTVPYKTQEIPYVETMNRCTHFAKRSSVELCALEIDRSTDLQLFLEEIPENKIIYRYLQITAYEEKIRKILENNLIQYLEINQKVNATIIRDVARSNYLTCLRLVDVTVDLYDLTNGGTKKYIYIDLCNCTLNCSKKLSVKECCNYLKIRDLKCVDGVTQMYPLYLDCDFTAIDSVVKKYPKWGGFKSVTYLSVHVPAELIGTAVFSKWKNLETLHFQIDQKSANLGKMPDVFKNLTKKIKKLVIEKKENSTAINLFKLMNTSWDKKIHLKTIDFIFLSLDDSEVNEVIELIEGLKCNRWDEVNLVSTRFQLETENPKLFKLRDELSCMNVTHYNYASNIDDAYNIDSVSQFQMFVYYYGFKVYDALSITKKSQDGLNCKTATFHKHSKKC